MNDEEKRAKRRESRWNKAHPGIPWPGYKESPETRDKKSKSISGEKNPWHGKTGNRLGEPGSMLNKTHSEKTRAHLSFTHLGDKNPMYGEHHTEKSRQLLREANSGEKASWFGKSLPESMRKQISMTKQGITNPEEWPGFIYRGKYCSKWTDPELKIRKRVRAFFGNRCIDCGATIADNKHRFLHVNHVGNNKQACCGDNPQGWLFVPLCTSCHSAASGTGQKEADKRYTALIDSKYGGKCYYSLEEYDRLVREGRLRTEDYGRRDGR